jgi:hypothetical protein
MAAPTGPIRHAWLTGVVKPTMIGYREKNIPAKSSQFLQSKAGMLPAKPN